MMSDNRNSSGRSLISSILNPKFIMVYATVGIFLVIYLFGVVAYGSKDFTKLFYRRISDQRVFLEHNIPAVMFTSGITLLNNKPTDNPASLDYEVLKDRVRLIFRYLDKVL